MFDSPTAHPHTPGADAEKARPSARPRPTFTHRIGALAATGLIAASLSVALPLQAQAAPPLDAPGTSVNDGTGQASLNTDAITAVTFIVTKGQKG